MGAVDNFTSHASKNLPVYSLTFGITGFLDLQKSDLPSGHRHPKFWGDQYPNLSPKDSHPKRMPRNDAFLRTDATYFFTYTYGICIEK